MWTRREWMTAGAAFVGAARGQQRQRRRRGECFFGVHFDLHPQESDTELGKDVTEENLREFLDRVKPDFVQYDAKGHAGWLGWPSRVSKSSPGIVRDSLAIWRKMTAGRGIPLYIHFSGVWDSLAVQERPEWARVDGEGKRDERQTSLWSGYAEERMIPQLLEVVEKYDLDGVWVDGECWQTNLDYGPGALRAWLQMGLGAEAPRKAGDAHWEVWKEFQRTRFRNYVKGYAEAVKAKRPQTEVCSNWLYSTYVPEKPDLPVDFLSGDYLGAAPIAWARLDARYLAEASRASGKAWDLMAWGFFMVQSEPTGPAFKPAVQLQQEASVVLAQGGGFQVYYTPTRSGYLDGKLIGTMEAVASFCRERQALAHGSESLSDVAVLFSKNSLYSKTAKMFGGWGAAVGPCVGMLEALLDNCYSVDVAPDWLVEGGAARWPVLVAPEWEDIGDRVARDLAARVRAGLHLVVVSAANARKFAPLFGWKLEGEARRSSVVVEGGGTFGRLIGWWQDVELGAGKLVASYYLAADSRAAAGLAAAIYEVGAGKVLLLPGPVGEAYGAAHDAGVKHFVKKCFGELRAPQIEMAGTAAAVEVAWRRKGSKRVLHVASMAGRQVAANHVTVDYVPPVPAGTRWRVRMEAAPERVTLEPRGRALEFRYEKGAVEFELPAIEVHAMVSFE